ncbi:MAG TPA: ribonuclease HII [Bacillales bacterium]|nr:ribonuclease HII [Bacillales bacterium]
MKQTIDAIRKRLFEAAETPTKAEMAAFRADDRKGVRELLGRWERLREKELLQKRQYIEMSSYERNLRHQGMERIAGVDEAGRGPLAGPVVAAAVILDPDRPLYGLNDSKQLTDKIREELYEKIIESNASVAIAIVEPEDIDRLNIYEASKRAMREAVLSLDKRPEHVLVDAMRLDCGIPDTAIVKGDRLSVSIAAGSIVAKVTRDRIMRRLDRRFPEYGFSRHFGYPTADHLARLRKHGPCEVHRRSFAPVREQIN